MPVHTLGRRSLARGAVAAAAAAATPASAADARGRASAILPDLLALLQDAMPAWQIPGAAIGVVAGESVLLARGLGLRRAGAPEAVDADTVFQIGSTTKAFAATTEAILVDQGKLGWMDRVIDHDPAFRLLDPWVTREFRIVDLLAQRSGLPPYVLDALWPLGFTGEDLAAALRHVRPVGSFRAEFAYQNVTHHVAGRIVAKLAGVPRWEDALARLILQPLGMRATTASAEALLAAPNRATGHVLYDGTLTPVPPVAAFPYGPGPAGAMNSCITDMAAWLRLLVGRGETGGKRLLAAGVLEDTWKPRVELPAADDHSSVWQAYASGWVMRQTAGGTAIWHNGDTAQFRAHVGFVPSLGVGIAILTNEGTNGLADAAGLWFYDRLLGNPHVDYNAQALTRARDAAAKAVARNRRPSTPAAPKPAGDYAGAYSSDVTGAARVGPAPDGALALSFERPGTRFRLLPWDGDVFTLSATDPDLAAFLDAGGPSFVQFLRTAQGAVDRMRFGDDGEIELSRAPGAGSGR